MVLICVGSVLAGKALPVAEIVAPGGFNDTITEGLADWCCPLHVSRNMQIVNNYLPICRNVCMINFHAVSELPVSRMGELVLCFWRSLLVCCVVNSDWLCIVIFQPFVILYCLPV